MNLKTLIVVFGLVVAVVLIPSGVLASLQVVVSIDKRKRLHIMRVEQFEVQFHNTNCIYIAGQSITGQVVIKFTKATWIDTLLIHFDGRAKSLWYLGQGRDDSSKRYEADEVYFNNEYCLYQSANPSDKHQVGMHVHPFDFTLPSDVPSSFEGRRGYVRYLCQVSLDMGVKGSLELEKDLTVIRHLDLSTVQRAAMSQNVENDEVYEDCCCDSGSVWASMRLPKSGFVPGEPMNYDIVISNAATSFISGIGLFLVQTVRYTGFSNSIFSSGNPKYHDKVNTSLLFSVDEEIGPGRTMNYNSFCVIPAVAPSELEGCSIIHIMYEVQLEVPVGWHTMHLMCEVYIGTIPLRLPSYRSGLEAQNTGDSLDNTPPYRQTVDMPPSYEECVFGRMESMEEGTDDIAAEEEEQNENSTINRGALSSSSRRSRFHRLPSYPYYGQNHFDVTSPESSIASPSQHPPSAPSTNPQTETNTYPLPPPLPPLSLSSSSTNTQTAQPETNSYPLPPPLPPPTSTENEALSLSSLPPPPSYESLHPS